MGHAVHDHYPAFTEQLALGRVQPTDVTQCARRPAKDGDERAPSERRAAIDWSQRLKRFFGIDVE
jgi:hypothetical protein